MIPFVTFVWLAYRWKKSHTTLIHNRKDILYQVCFYPVAFRKYNMAQSAFLITNFTETKMTQETSQIEVPILEATSDGKRIFTPKQLVERFRPYKKKLQYRIVEILRGADVTQNGWTEKNEIQDFIWCIGPEALYQKTRAE